MKIMALADIHSEMKYLDAIGPELRQMDLLLLAGDITNFGGRDDIREILRLFCKYNQRILAVPGNCDGPSVNDYLAEKKINLHCNCIRLNDIAFFGVGGSLPCAQLTPFESGEHDFVALLESVEKKIESREKRVLLTHQPAYGTKLDLAGGADHRGSHAIEDFVMEHEPVLAVSGHIHDARGTDTIGSTVLVNPGPFRNGCYAVMQINEKVDNIELKNA